MQGIWSVLQPLLEMPDDVDAVPFHHVLLGVKFHEPSLPRASYLPAYVLASSWAAERPTLVPMPAVAEVVAAWRRRIAMGSLTLDTAAAAAYPVTTDTVLLPGRLHVVTSQTPDHLSDPESRYVCCLSWLDTSTRFWIRYHFGVKQQNL